MLSKKGYVQFSRPGVVCSQNDQKLHFGKIRDPDGQEFGRFLVRFSQVQLHAVNVSHFCHLSEYRKKTVYSKIQYLWAYG